MWPLECWVWEAEYVDVEDLRRRWEKENRDVWKVFRKKGEAYINK